MKVEANAYGMMEMDDDDPIEFKPIKVTGSVNARFVLLDAKGKPINEWPVR